MEYKTPDEIYPIPQIPPEIKQAAVNEKLVIFIGAGASRIIGCGGWKELANQLVDAAYKEGRINFQEKGKIVNEYEPRKTITIFKQILPKEIYKEILVNSLNAKKEKLDKYPIYEELFRMRGIYLTTNVDTYFDQFFEEAKIFTSLEQFKPEQIKLLSLFHLHGSVKDFSTVIFATQEYIRHYNNEKIKDFLRHIFNTNLTVLFIGYSLSELEILDYVLLKGNLVEENAKESKEIKHFILLPFYKAEKNMFKFERQYFAGLNVSAIPYAIDEKGYEQLYYVIEAWEKEINISSPFLYKSYQFIEQNIDHYIEANATEVFQLIKNDEHFRNHFFKNLKSIEWFYPLKEKGYFAPNESTQPQEAGEQGYFTIPQWNVLPYLERVSEQANIPGNEKYIDELLNIIKEVTEYHIKHNKILDNYRTWWYFGKILLNIPNNKISFDIIELIPTWLDSRFDSSLPGADIARKLLPKFLGSNDSDDWKKAERIVKIITEIKWIPLPEKSGLLLRKTEEPKTILDTFWLKESFKVNAVKIGEKCSENIIFTLASRLKEIFRREHSYWIDIEFGNQKYRISTNPLNDDEYQVSVGIIKEQDLASGEPEEEFIEDLKIKPQELFNFRLENCGSEKEFVDGVKQAFIKNEIFADLKDEFDKKLRQLYQGIFIDYSYIWLKSISSKPTIHGTKEILTSILRNIVLAKVKKDKEVSERVLRKFLSNQYQYPFFRRLVLFVAGSQWDTYKNLFWEMVDEGKTDELFNDPNYEAEIYELLQDNIGQFTPEEKEKIKEIINKGPHRYFPEKDQEKYIAYWKQKWFSVLKQDPDFAALYEQQKKISGIKREEFTFGTQIVSWVGPGPSPLAKEDILKMSNQELSKFLKEFKTKDKWKGPTVGGLSEILRKTAKENPEKFIENLNAFLDTGYIYIYEVLWGIKEAWNEKKAIEWGKLLTFIEKYIDRKDFWEDRFIIKDEEWPASHATHLWVVGIIAETLQEGTKNDSWAFPEEYFEEAQKIIFLILENLKLEDEEEIRDFVHYTLNSPLGKTISALIYLVLHIARINKKKGVEEEIRWSYEIRSKYDEILDKEVIEGFTLLGQHLPHLYYLDKEWAQSKISGLDSQKGTEFWEAFMHGYLLGGRVYDDLYRLMRSDYLYGIGYKFKEKHVEERLIQHIAIGYLRNHESIDNTESLFRRVLDAWKAEHIKEIIGFFWMQKDYLKPSSPENESIRQRIITFWRWVYENKYKQYDELSQEDKEILSDLSKLTVFLPKIDSENVNWLLTAASYVHVDFNSPFFIEYLNKLKDKDLETSIYVGEVFLKMLEASTPDYDQKHIRSIVEHLYHSDCKDSADKICNIYGSRGLEFLRDIYEKYQKK